LGHVEPADGRLEPGHLVPQEGTLHQPSRMKKDVRHHFVIINKL